MISTHISHSKRGHLQ